MTGGMEEETRNGAPTRQGLGGRVPNLGATLRVAWLAILLGMAMEAILLLLSAGLGDLLGLGPSSRTWPRTFPGPCWSASVCRLERPSEVPACR